MGCRDGKHRGRTVSMTFMILYAFQKQHIVETLKVSKIHEEFIIAIL